MVRNFNHRIQFSDLKRIVLTMRCNGLTEAEVMQKVIYCFNELDMVGDE